METVEDAMCCTGIEAVAIDSLDLTRSRGYVVPEMPAGKKERALCQSKMITGDATEVEGSDGQTEVIPANAPAASRVGVSNVFLPLLVKSWRGKGVSVES